MSHAAGHNLINHFMKFVKGAHSNYYCVFPQELFSFLFSLIIIFTCVNSSQGSVA